MRWIQFPSPESASEDGVVATGGDLSIPFLVSAYAQGIFPWPHEGYPLLWFSPWQRGVLEFKNLHVSRSLQKWARQNPELRVTIDQDFAEVIKYCANSPRPGQNGTWITKEVIEAYCVFHQAGYAHSLEVRREGRLIGGIYGVFVKNVFSAESMFFLEPNASKWALWQLVIFLQKLGLDWMDVQMVTNVSESFGAKIISQKEFLLKLRKNQEMQPIKW